MVKLFIAFSVAVSLSGMPDSRKPMFRDLKFVSIPSSFLLYST
jgi:hypothetical protein